MAGVKGGAAPLHPPLQAARLHHHRSDPQHRPTVIDLLAKGGVKEYVYPVGRLDYDSEGCSC